MSYREVDRAIRECGWADDISVILSGGAVGVDRHGETWADQHRREIERHPILESEWRKHGKAAGPMRNRRMARAADAAIVVWDGSSRGSKNMIFEARAHALRLHVHVVGPEREPSAGGRP